MNEKETVLSYLEDDESRLIFNSRIEYNETGKWEPIKKMVDACVPELRDKHFYPEKQNEIIDIINKNNYDKIWVWGAGICCVKIKRFLDSRGVDIMGFIDADNTKSGKLCEGVKIYAPDSVDFQKIDCLIISMLDKNIVDECILSAKKLGMNENGIIIYRDYTAETVYDRQYFEDFVKYQDNEIFVDAGVFDLDTTIRFFNDVKKQNVKNAKSIAFEPDKDYFNKCMKIKEKYNSLNIELVNSGLWCENTKIGFSSLGNQSSRINKDETANSIDVVTLDSYTDEKITFIKMDIEGAELEALNGCKETIKKCKPKLAISVYHKPEDIIKIPLYVKSLVPEYKIYFRHYSNWSTETVMYALPY